MSFGNHSFGSTSFAGLNTRDDMTRSISTQYITDTNQSLLYFLNNEIYIRSGADSYAENTLKNFFSGLSITLGYVDNLNKLKLPSLSLIPPVTLSGGEDQAFGNHVQTEEFNFQIQGYMGGKSSHENNLLERDRLVQDLKSLLEDQDYIALQYLNSSNNIIDTGKNITVTSTSVVFLPPVEQPEASRYRFALDFDIEYLKKI